MEAHGARRARRRLVVIRAIGAATAWAMTLLGACKHAIKRKSPYLSQAQQAQLAKLQSQSQTPLGFTVWPAGGTISSLQLKVPLGSGAPTNVTDQAKQFVMANRGLWKVSAAEQLSTGCVSVGEVCTTVTLHVKHLAGPEIYNATISVGIGPRATVQMVSARASGEPAAVHFLVLG